MFYLFSYFLATTLFKTNTKLEGNITDVCYVIEYNMAIYWALVHHSTYFKYLNKSPFKKPTDFRTINLEKCSLVSGIQDFSLQHCSLWQESVFWTYIDVPQLAVHRNWLNHWRHLSTFFESQILNMWHNVLGAIIGLIIPIMQYYFNTELEQSRQCSEWDEVLFYNVPRCTKECWSQRLLKEQVKERCN